MPTGDISRTILCRSMSAASPLRASIRPGKGGLKSTDRGHIKERKPGIVESSRISTRNRTASDARKRRIMCSAYMIGMPRLLSRCT